MCHSTKSKKEGKKAMSTKDTNVTDNHCIQGVTGGTDQTSGECSLGQTIPI